jgi:hypothetical protein
MKNGSHWAGCYEAHHECAIAVIERLRGDLDANNATTATLRATVADLMADAELQRLEIAELLKWAELPPGI